MHFLLSLSKYSHIPIPTFHFLPELLQHLVHYRSSSCHQNTALPYYTVLSSAVSLPVSTPVWVLIVILCRCCSNFSITDRFSSCYICCSCYPCSRYCSLEWSSSWSHRHCLFYCLYSSCRVTSPLFPLPLPPTRHTLLRHSAFPYICTYNKK